MRIYSISDIHVDYSVNMRWVKNLSSYEFKDDSIILAGDISSAIDLIEDVFNMLSKKFSEVFYVPGNHDLWSDKNRNIDSFMKFEEIKIIADFYNIHMKSFEFSNIAIMPLFSWYDYSFGELSNRLVMVWSDFSKCKWYLDMEKVNDFFLSLNNNVKKIKNKKIITFSHFLPSIELMSPFIPQSYRFMYPVLGSSLLMNYIKKLNSNIHIYGHTHVNNTITKDNTIYINNAFGYPNEYNISAKKLKCVYKE